MTISFTVADDASGPRPCATVSARHLAAFRSFAESQRERTGIDVIDNAGQGFAAYDFEARVCPFALALLAAIFDHDETAIEVLEDAQFRGRLVRFGRDHAGGTIRLWVSSTPDDALRLDVTKASAYAILRALQIPAYPIGGIGAEALRSRLLDPATRTRFSDNDIAHHLAHLFLLAWIGAPDANTRIIWA